MDRSFRDFFALSLRNRNLVPQLFFASIPCPAIASQDIRLNAYFLQFSIFNRTAKLAADKIIKLFNVDVVTHFLPMQVVLNREIEIPIACGIIVSVSMIGTLFVRVAETTELF